MTERRDDYSAAWIQGGTARIPAPGEPGGRPVVVDDTPPEIKEHLRREAHKDGILYELDNLAKLYGDHHTAFAEARKTMTLADAKGFIERSLKVYDADVLASAEGAPTDDARQRFVDHALDLRGALETRAAETESIFHETGRRSALEIKAGALSRQAAAYPEDYALHAAMVDKITDGAAVLVKPETAAEFRRIEAEKVARSAVMGFIEQGRFDEGRALLAMAGEGALPLASETVAELGGLLEARRGQAAAREERLDRVDTVIEGTAGPADDPTEWKELVEEHYQVVAPQMAELEPAERIEVEDDYVRKLGHLPAPLTRFLRAGMLSGEPDQEAAAALRIAGLADHDPALVAAIPEAERARAAAIAEFAELGLKPARAVELGDEKLTIRDKFLRPDDPLAEPTPEPYRPGYVWEDGRWRPETPEEAQGKNMPEVAEQAADGGAGDDDGGARAKTPTDGTPKDEDAGRDGVLGDKSEEKGEDEKAEPQSEDPSASSANDENLNRIERSLHNKAELARKLGLDFAADSLERFLDGSGIAMNLERDKARRFDALRGAEATNQQRVVERGFLGKQATPHKHNVTLKKMKDGETIKLAKDHWDRDFTTQGLAIGGELNFALATGHSKFKTEGEYRATRKGDVIYIEGTATHAWKDRYDFHGKDDLGGDAKRLQDAGRGKPFDIKSEWRQHLKGTIRIENGNLSDPKFQWTDAK